MNTEELNPMIYSDKDFQVLQSLNSIECGRASIVNQAHGKTFGTYVVMDKYTHLRGLITEDGKEIIPCICDWITVHLDGYTEVTFKQQQFEFLLGSEGVNKSIGFTYGDGLFYALRPNKRCKDPKSGKTYMVLEQDEVTSLLIEILNRNHCAPRKESED